MIFPQKLSTLLSDARINCGLSQREVCKVLQISQNTLERYENQGIEYMSVGIFLALCDLYDLSPGEIISASTKS